MASNCSSNLTTSDGDTFCEMDSSILCWPRTKSGENVTQKCPSDSAIFDSSKVVSRFCSWNGTWVETTNKLTIQCYTEEIRTYLTKLNKTGEYEIKKFIINFARHLELTGLSLSLITLLISIVIFFHFRCLRNHRTSIHRSLFIATALHVTIRLILYIDQHTTSFIEEELALCVGCYILLEFARTAMFTWMFVEGLYLHNVITIAVFQESRYNIIYQCLGWGAPAIFSAIWISFMYQCLGRICLFGYIHLPQFWILEGPRIAFMVVNLIFLILIINILRQKLRQHRANHLEQARKSIKAALVLLPLLGVPNLVQMVLEPIDQPAWIFGLWTIITCFLASFQGFFVALLFCFLNGEVRPVLYTFIVRTAVNSWRNVSQDFRTVYTSIHRGTSTSSNINAV